MKQLIVNADDFGFTEGVNAGILHTFKAGIVTSTSIMATGKAFEAAADIARANPELAVGCHLSLLGGQSVAPPQRIPSLVDDNGLMPTSLWQLVSKLIRAVVRTSDIECEFRAQIERTLAAGITPTHVDTHKHVHTHPRVMQALLRVAREYGIKRVRNPFETIRWPALPKTPAYSPRWEYLKQYAVTVGLSPGAGCFRRLVAAHRLRAPDHFSGAALTGFLDKAAVRTVIGSLRNGTTELVCHPGFYDDELERAPTRLKRHRERELGALTDPGIRRFIHDQGITLISYQDLT